MSSDRRRRRPGRPRRPERAAGYVTDTTCTWGFYGDMSPFNVNYIAMMHGFAPVDLERPFSYLKLGCGNGTASTPGWRPEVRRDIARVLRQRRFTRQGAAECQRPRRRRLPSRQPS